MTRTWGKIIENTDTGSIIRVLPVERLLGIIHKVAIEHIIAEELKAIEIKKEG